MDDTTDKLKPCTFCGERVVANDYRDKPAGEWVMIHRCKMMGPIRIGGNSLERIQECWNTRAESAEVTALREREARLVEALREAREAAHSVAHSEYDGVWNETDFSNFTPLADAALAEIEKEAGE